MLETANRFVKTLTTILLVQLEYMEDDHCDVNSRLYLTHSGQQTDFCCIITFVPTSINWKVKHTLVDAHTPIQEKVADHP